MAQPDAPRPMAPGAHRVEAEAFKDAQAALLRKYGVAARSRFVDLRRPVLSAHLLEAGRGDPLLLLHGGGACACMFVPLMSRLKGAGRILAVDRPGCGLTETFDYRVTALREHAVDFITSLLDQLEAPRVALAGSSMGGLWAIQFALARPERVTRLVLLGEPAWSPKEMTHPPPTAEPNPTFESVRAGLASRQVGNIERVPVEVVRALLAAKRMPGAADSWNSLRARFLEEQKGTYHLRSELKSLRPSTLFIWGEDDTFGPPTLGDEMARLAPRARCETLREAGHWPWLDQPDRCGQLVTEFLREK